MPYKDPKIRRIYHEAYTKAWRLRNPEKVVAMLLRSRPARLLKERERKRQCRLAALEAYGKVCTCCGEATYEFLAIDHIDGGGKEHRRQLNGTRLEVWLKQNNYPSGFQVLCHNCNMAKGFYGTCPHKKAA